MLYELRVYRCPPGRLRLLLDRFEKTTLQLWDKHGIRQAGFWTVEVGESNNELYYLLAWESLDERQRKWHAFETDPEWRQCLAETGRDGPLVANVTNSILKPTSFPRSNNVSGREVAEGSQA